MLNGECFHDLPEEIALPRRERSSCDADFLVIRSLPACVGKNVAQRRLGLARAFLQARGKIAVQPACQRLFRFQRDETCMLSGYTRLGLAENDDGVTAMIRPSRTAMDRLR